MEGSRFGTNAGYGIEIKPIDTNIRILRNGTVLAESRSAKVMYETRLTPQVYIPRDDILVPLSPQNALKTFCPFKGTARYRDILLDGHTIANGVWSYDDAMPESRAINGHIGFMPEPGVEVDFGGAQLEPVTDGNITGPLVDWLMRWAAFEKTPEDFMAALGRKMQESGIAIKRMAAMIWSLHPMIAGRHYIWTRDTDEITTYTPSYDLHSHPSYLNSPLYHVSQGLGGVRQKLDVPGLDMKFPIMDELRAEGATDYVAMPLFFSNGQINVLTLTSDHPKGFTTANLGLIFEVSSVISRFFEVFTQKENAQSLLETYVGPRTGARVLGGEIRRGDGDDIDAAIMFCDLRDSTRMEEELGRAAYIDLLNTFFETASTIIENHGGEVLKFIGDAVLAVFPDTEDGTDAGAAALHAAREIVQQLEALRDEDPPIRCDCSIGISYGRVTYGNVGSRERLDFTVIGRPANVAARLGDYGKKLGHRIVVSDEVARHEVGCKSLGEVTLHNVKDPVTCFAISADT
ncbi:DUF427 domain-containing protein [Shimia sp. MMG029]|uniref:DUF427 domain-containing protein n=1 Tax=Shimia sp. MMG029 TaxID=3021978 RepID=UPI0022FEA4EE|nr:DUF427 domain-containing protein [Shimia sp. MMG029]MDA5558635.1 DUF427 domain-containing protein [Shimia sp. MMG029]